MSLLALSASSASAETQNLSKVDGSIRSTLEAYDKVLLPEDRKWLETLISGMETGLVWANAMLKNRQQPLLYCEPEKLTLTDDQIIDMMR